jgi:hypothetical protein
MLKLAFRVSRWGGIRHGRDRPDADRRGRACGTNLTWAEKVNGLDVDGGDKPDAQDGAD